VKTESKFTYKLKLSYKGTHYYGWQFQTTQEETVQNHVQRVVSDIAKHKGFQVIGASRTDAGVHASGQVLKVVLPREVSPENLTRGMNSKLPADIKVLSSEFIHEDFNVNRDCKNKEYHYYFTTDQNENAAFSETIYSFPEKPDLEKMKEACQRLVGMHNFKSFSSQGPDPASPYRELLSCSIERTSFLTFENEIYFLKIKGTGFLRYMVRYLMGALWDVGMGKLTLEELDLSLSSGEIHGIRTKAPSRGLHLINIEY
jgi:tRNA pseudouridine38-40 synthase